MPDSPGGVGHVWPAIIPTYTSAAQLRMAVGTELGPTPWFDLDQGRVDGFADATLDRQWIHVDVERSVRESSFGGTIAHGFLTLSLVPYFVSQLRRVEKTRMGVNYGLDKVRFPSPVLVGSRIRGRATIVNADMLGDNVVQVVTRATIEAEGSDKPACVVDLIARYYFDVEG